MLFCLVAQLGQNVHIVVGDINTALAALFIIHFKVRDHLLKGKLERISYVMEKRGKTPELQEHIGGFSLLLLSSIRIHAIKLPELATESTVRLIDRKPQCKHIDRMGIMIPVFHQQRASVGLKLGEEFYHLLGFPVVTEEDLKITIVDLIGVLRCSRIDKALQRLFQTETVKIHLHVVGNLIRLYAASLILPGLLFLFFDRRVKPQFLAALMKEAKRSGFEVCPLQSAAEKRRLRRADVLPVSRPIFCPHFFQCSICHRISLPFMIRRDLCICFPPYYIISVHPLTIFMNFLSFICSFVTYSPSRNRA